MRISRWAAGGIGSHPRRPGRRVARLLTIGIVAALSLALMIPAHASTTLFAQWHMDETSGTVMHDSSGNGNNGTLSNVTVGVAGFQGSKAYSFNGTSSKVTVSSSSSLNPGSSNFTLIVHVKFNVKPPPNVGDYDIIRKGLSGSSGGDYKMEILGSGQASCHWTGSKGSTPDTKPGGPNLADGKWHTIKCKKMAGQEQLVVDGVKAWTQNVKVGSISNSDPLTLGAKTSGSPCCDWYKGTMDEVTVQKG